MSTIYAVLASQFDISGAGILCTQFAFDESHAGNGAGSAGSGGGGWGGKRVDWKQRRKWTPEELLAFQVKHADESPQYVPAPLQADQWFAEQVVKVRSKRIRQMQEEEEYMLELLAEDD
jgi:hypothetical protein